ncbi:MAG: FAD-dependent oxidoreductase, partial [Rhodobacteraceae bacterium]|nr:FAD-dependent oxidoreductase [Paracoccaceae bacterium]
VLIVGAGPIGLAAAIELANHGIPSVVIDDNDVVSVGSRAICWSKRALEVLDRLGDVGQRAVEKGVTWKIGRTHHRDTEVYHFDLLPESGHKMPAFVNLQQYHVEEYLISEAQRRPLIDLRFKNRLADLDCFDDHASALIETPDGPYRLEADWLIACDGARSPVRNLLGLDFAGELFEERFLIADIEMEADFPSERWFWFEPTFHPGQSALLHKQPDNIYRIDLQLGWDTDPEVEKRPENILPRIRKVVGERDFRLDWSSIYTFQCRRLGQFVHGPVIFAGDSAHIVSPFGARGGNGGLQDVDALCWRLAAVIKGRAPTSCLQAYDRERQHAADENILNSSRTTRFMTPAPGVERLFRDSVLDLAARAPFARALVNSGRLSVPCIYPVSGADDPDMPPAARPGAVAPDAPLEGGWLLDVLGRETVLLCLGQPAPADVNAHCLSPALSETIRCRYLGKSPAGLYLIRPDQIIAARWATADVAILNAAIAAMWEGRI